MAAVIERGERSPLGISGFCRAEGLGTASFYKWRQRLAAAAPSEALAPVKEPRFLDLDPLAGPISNGSAWDIELKRGAGVVLRLRRG
ncbi:IS66 family insertion sequence element accessory protein TnpB [uncultured Thiodictyon sp.]|uniref:IS66 family insertion sequence element accessory protein TnpA n=1 Tax=uncultured Thiodictyon sp. TaxID=1846217 RepID=UPI002600C06C|nr:IS66 family insertion sequence element accessory protein TnpB [uncultured Thiodictyon sp.]